MKQDSNPVKDAVTLEREGEALDLAVARRDAGALQCAMAEAERDVEEGGAVAWVFADGLALLLVKGGFEAFVGAAASPLVEPAAVHRVCNSKARRWSGEQLGAIAAAAGAPQPRWERTRLLRAALVGHKDAAVTRGLAKYIRQHAGELHAGSGAGTGPARGLVVADTVAALGERTGAEVAAELMALGREMPWGEDRYATAALLEGLLRHEDGRCQEVVKEIMAQHSEPGEVRLMLLAAEHTLSAEGAEQRLLKDLRMPLGLDVHWEYLQLLRTWLMGRKAAGEGVSESTLGMMRGLMPEEWPTMLRVMYGLILREAMPGHEGLARLTARDRLRAGLIRGFEMLRVDSGAHAWMLPMLFAVTVVVSTALNALLERPTLMLRSINGTAILLWMLVMVMTSRTRFTGMEKPGQKWRKALMFWGATGLMVVIVVGTRVM